MTETIRTPLTVNIPTTIITNSNHRARRLTKRSFPLFYSHPSFLRTSLRVGLLRTCLNAGTRSVSREWALWRARNWLPWVPLLSRDRWITSFSIPKQAVANAGGIGVIGGVRYTPSAMRRVIKELKANLTSPELPWGVDLLLPQVGGNARATNTDYTLGKLDELVDIMIEEGAKLFVSAVGVPPVWVVERLHAAGIPVMNMVGHPKHVAKALEVGVDLICAQGGEAGGHTGDVMTSVLVPKVVDLCKGRVSPLTGKPVIVLGAGGISDGRGMAMALALGASGVWVGTRFVNSKEAGASPRFQRAIIEAGHGDTVRTLIYSGRPMRVLRTGYVDHWFVSGWAVQEEQESSY